MTTIGIVQINDTHANLLPQEDVRYTGRGFRIEKLGGFARMMTKITEFQAENPDRLLVLDNGDTFHGTYEAVQSKGEVMVPYLHSLGVNAMTFHWDSAYTPKHLLELEKMLEYPVLAANVYRQDTKQLLFEPFRIFEANGLSIGVIGIASNIIQKNMPKEFWEGADFTDGIEEAGKWAAYLKEQDVDLVVLLSHLGYPQDIALLKQVDGIDLCLSGHTHNRVRSPQKIENAYIIQSGALASSMGYLKLEIKDKNIVNMHHAYIVLDETVAEDPDMAKMLKEDAILDQHKAYLDEKIGETTIDLHRGSSFQSTMDYLLLDAMREATGKAIAFSNGWRYGGAVSKGALTRRNLYQIVPMDPLIRTAELSGQEIWTLLEDNLESTFSTEPFKQMGGYIKRNAGLKVYFKPENPYGHRIQRIFAGEEVLDPEKTYAVAYVTRQAVPEEVGRKHANTKVHAVEAMERLLAHRPYSRDDTESYIPV